MCVSPRQIEMQELDYHFRKNHGKLQLSMEGSIRYIIKSEISGLL